MILMKTTIVKINYFYGKIRDHRRYDHVDPLMYIKETLTLICKEVDVIQKEISDLEGFDVIIKSRRRQQVQNSKYNYVRKPLLIN